MTIELLEAIDTRGLILADRHVLRDHIEDVIVTAMARGYSRRA
ncbi:MAG: hypothetical protein ACLQPH_01490 [Acidimicrobiales bacterium]